MTTHLSFVRTCSCPGVYSSDSLLCMCCHYRELLLRENKQLRSLLEAHLVTTRTSRVTASHNLAGQSFAQGDDDVAAGGAARGDQSPPSAGYATGSHNQVQGQSRVAKTGPATARTGNRVLPAALMPHMEVVRGLAEAGRELEAAESSYGLPQMHHAASQVTRSLDLSIPNSRSKNTDAMGHAAVAQFGDDDAT